MGFVYGLIAEFPVGRIPSAEGVLFSRTADLDEPTDEPPSGVLMFLLCPIGFAWDTLDWLVR